MHKYFFFHIYSLLYVYQPFTKVLVWVYSWTFSGSCKQDTWHSCDFHISQTFSESRSSTPNVSRPCSPLNVFKRWSNNVAVFSVPRVWRRQWRDNSFLEMDFNTRGWSSSKPSSNAFAIFNLAKSSTDHSKMHWESLPMNVAYNGCDSVVQAEAILLMKCHMSNLTHMASQPGNKEPSKSDREHQRSLSAKNWAQSSRLRNTRERKKGFSLR